MKISLRKYQVEWCRAVWRALFEGVDGQTFDRVLGVAATGAGKTAMASAMMFKVVKMLKGRALFLANTTDLILQGATAIERNAGIIPTIEQAGDFASLDADIAVASIQSISQPARLHRFPPDHFKLVVGDEAHGSQAEQYQTILKYFGDGGAKVLGITATPERSDRKSLMRFFQYLAAEVPLKQLISEGYLSPIVVQTCPVEISVGTFAENDAEGLAEDIRPYYEAVIDGIAKYAADRRRTLIFHPTIEASQTFAEMMRARGLNADHIDGTMKDRARVLESFSTGRIQWLNNAQLLTTGVDIPAVDCVIVLRPTKSRSTYIQMIGRGTRRYCPHGCHRNDPPTCEHPDRKQDVLVLDFLWQFQNKDVMGPADLYSDDPEEKEEIKRKLKDKPDELQDLMQLGFMGLDEKSKIIIDMLKRNATKQATRFNAQSFAAAFQPELIHWEPQSAWDDSAPSEGQLRVLRNNGLETEGITRGLASKLIDIIMERHNADMATAKQVIQLIRFGHPTPFTLTFPEASAFLDTKLKKR